MPRYQIRTPDEEVIEDVIGSLSGTTWRILKAWDVFEAGTSSKDFENFHRAISRQIDPYIKTYRLCGLSNICLDEAEKTEWSPAIDSLQASPRDLVYHLFPGNGLEFFLDRLVTAAIDSLKERIKPELMEEVRSLMKTAFRAVLGQYIYSNPSCGKTELCVYSSSSPQKVWGRSRF
jgi:hypothetical protein